MNSIETMTDKEFEKLLDEVAGPRAENIQQPDQRFTERHDGPTPSGGDYSIAYYSDANHNPCLKEQAKYVNTVEYTQTGERINEVYGVLGR
jgi:hypothetical protein